MEGASFEARLTPREAYGPSGGDEVEFLIAPNPGVPAGPLRETASGGELSRVMLALMSVAAEAGPRTLVFDEVDAGIGGQTARAVGEQLRALAAGRQVICITHLPQIASMADRHFTIVKDTSADPARTTVTLLERRRRRGGDRADARRRGRRRRRAAAREGAAEGGVARRSDGNVNGGWVGRWVGCRRERRGGRPITWRPDVLPARRAERRVARPIARRPDVLPAQRPQRRATGQGVAARDVFPGAIAEPVSLPSRR